jgi:hypothetical protein
MLVWIIRVENLMGLLRIAHYAILFQDSSSNLTGREHVLRKYFDLD